MSPPYTPEYNGACEAGIGSIKLRAHLESARHDRPGQWTCDDIEAARLMANETARPRGTPKQSWNGREPVTPVVRAAFHETYSRLECESRQALGFPRQIDLGRVIQPKVDRIAISQALIAHGFLFVRRRRLSLPKKRRFWRRIA
jgi:hypothetical protein